MRTTKKIKLKKKDFFLTYMSFILFGDNAVGKNRFFESFPSPVTVETMIMFMG